MKGHTAYVTEEELAAFLDVDGAPPELRRQAEATLGFLVDTIIKNPIDMQPLLEARASGDPFAIEGAATGYGFQLGMRAREFHLDAASWELSRRHLAGALCDEVRSLSDRVGGDESRSRAFGDVVGRHSG